MSDSITANTKSTLSASDLRVTLDNLFGEHAVHAMNATDADVTGSKSFPAAAKALDNNSVALSKAIGSIYSTKAANTFLNGKFMWRAHIRFFVDYTVAKAKKDHRRSGQSGREPEAVHGYLRQLPRRRDRAAQARGTQRLAQPRPRAQGTARLVCVPQLHQGSLAIHSAYNHMFMTSDLVAAAIAKQKGLG